MANIRENNGDASENTGTSYTIVLGDVFQGMLDQAADKDWVKIELTAETVYDITLTGVESARLKLLDSAGNHIISGGVITSGSKLIFSPTVSGTYYIHVASEDSDHSGEYELSVIENTIPEGSYDEVADYLTDGFRVWQGTTRRSFDIEPSGVLTADISALTEDGQQLANWALEAWTNVTGINFELVEDDNAHITFDDNEDGGFARSTVVDGIIISSHVNISVDWFVRYGNTIGTYTFQSYIHEIGHALGLGHSGPYNFDEYGDPIYYGLANIFLIDTWQTSIMSYMSQIENTYINVSRAFVITPMIADIIAIQNLYGASNNINIGDTVYGYNSNLDGYLGQFFKLWTGDNNPFTTIEIPNDTDTPTLKLAVADLDSDGDTDLVIGNDTGLLYYFENTGTSASPSFTEHNGSDNPLGGFSVAFYSTPRFVDLDGDGDYDLVVGNSSGEVAYFENTGTATSPNFAQRTGTANPFDNITMGSWSTLALADLDGDGDPDLSVGNDDSAIHYYENTGTSANPSFTLRSAMANPMDGIDVGSYGTPEFIDYDDDDDFDLVVGNGSGVVYYFENTGTTTAPTFIQRTDSDNPFDGVNLGSFIAPVFVDLDADSNIDLIVGNQDGVIHYLTGTETNDNSAFSSQGLAPATFTIYDNGGNDTLDLRTDTYDQRIYLRPEGISDVYGLTGNLIIARDTWIENFIAGSGNDLVAGNAIANYLNGRDGDDRIWGSGGDDILEGGAGADQLDGDAGMDWVSYRDSDAAVTVNLANATVSGGHADGDVLTEIENVIGSDYEDVLTGNDDTNRLEGGAGADQLDGGAGVDWVSYQWSDAGVTVDLAEGTFEGGDAQGDGFADIEHIVGSDHQDVLTGDNGPNVLYGIGGDDELQGNGGDDQLEGGVGSDRLDGGAGEDILSYLLSDAGVTINLENGTAEGGDAQGDVITGFENVVGSEHRDVLAGDGGANVLYGIGGADELLGDDGDDVLEGGIGSDRLNGGAGVDWVSYYESDAGVTVNLSDNTASGGHAQGDVLSNIENIAGSLYQDVLTGDDGANELFGYEDDDELQGNDGDDVLEGGGGSDRLYGGSGTDTVSYKSSYIGVRVNLKEGTLEGGHAVGDVLTGIENIAGSVYRDVLVGDDGVNRLDGDEGDDELKGDIGNDQLFGNLGDDWLYGGDGDDELRGNEGNDRLFGEVGEDDLYGDEGDDELHGVNRKLKCPLFRILKCPLVDKEMAVSIILCISPYLATAPVSLQAPVPTTLPCASPSTGNSPP